MQFVLAFFAPTKVANASQELCCPQAKDMLASFSGVMKRAHKRQPGLLENVGVKLLRLVSFPFPFRVSLQWSLENVVVAFSRTQIVSDLGIRSESGEKRAVKCICQIRYKGLDMNIASDSSETFTSSPSQWTFLWEIQTGISAVMDTSLERKVKAKRTSKGSWRKFFLILL